MNSSELSFIRACLPKERTKYYYYKDRYALQLLAWKLGDQGMPIGSLKTDVQAKRFLNKPSVQAVIQSASTGILDSDQLSSYWPEHKKCHAFRLTLGQWGEESRTNDSWFQTSRAGLNLVLQLNFSASHDRVYRDKIKVFSNKDPFVFTCHPIQTDKFHTLAWSRLDVDLDGGVVLIEEIQNDWLREAKFVYKRIQGALTAKEIDLYSVWHYTTVRRFLQYYENYIVALERLWDEAMLSASLWFLKEELGISEFYYHTWESGLYFKGLEDDCGPPRSLYTQLPKRFGFEQIEEGPRFIQQKRRKQYHSKKCRNKKDSITKWWYLKV